MELYYRLEFSEEQQVFHADNYKCQEGTNGWFTIFEKCTDTDFYIYESYVNLIPQKRKTKEYLLKCATEVKQFQENLLNYGLVITRQSNIMIKK